MSDPENTLHMDLAKGRVTIELLPGFVHGGEPAALRADIHHRLAVFLQVGAIGI